MKICVIGNSHVAAVKTGWDRIQHEFPRVEMTYFAARARYMRDLRVRGGILEAATEQLRKLIASTSGGESTIDPSHYDGFLVVGSQLGLVYMLHMFASYRLFGFMGSTPGATMLSEACFHETARAQIDRSLAICLVRRLRSITGKPICVCPEPLLDERAPQFEPFWQRDAELGYSLLSGLFDEKINQLQQELNFKFIPQPGKTVANEIFTAQEYKSGSIRLQPGFDAKHDETDLMHMNSKYGALVIRSVMAEGFSLRPEPAVEYVGS
jgi:hypothetical protein